MQTNPKAARGSARWELALTGAFAVMMLAGCLRQSPDTATAITSVEAEPKPASGSPVPAVPQSGSSSTAPSSTPAAPPPNLDDPKSCIDSPPKDSPASGEAAKEMQGHVAGSLSPELIRQHVRQQYGDFRSCYAAGLERYSQLTGKVAVWFEIGVGGKVVSARVDDTDLPDCTVVRCVREVMSNIVFPSPEGGNVTVLYPIMLQPE